jgi:HPt (histidine-containing phosphotransfer) domain-containing protein
VAAGLEGYLSMPIGAQELLAAGAGGGRAGGAPAEAPPPEPPRRAAFDWQAALPYVAGDKELLRRLVGVFLDSCPGWLDELRKALSAGDAGTVRRTAHTIKGPLGLFAVKPPFEIAQQLERMGNEKDLTGADAVRVRLEADLERLRPALEAFAAEGGAGG